MNDPQSLGLGELGQRVQALSDPVSEPRLRPYQGAPLPGAPASNGRPAPSYESYDSLDEFRVTPVNPAPSTHQAPPSPFGSAYPGGYPASAPAAAQPAEPVNIWEHSAPSSPAASPSPSSSSASAAPPPEDPNAPKSGLQRAINAVRSAIPIVQKLLPLLDGNFATAISALVVPQQQQQHHAPPPVQVDLNPIERGLAEIHNSHRELRGQVAEQSVTLKRVEDQLERVREATDRNTLEQQELVEDLRAAGGRITLIAVIGGILLAVSLGLNIWFLFRLQHILY